MTQHRDDDLKHLFHRLKSEEQKSLPSFESLLARRHPPLTLFPSLIRISFAAVFLLLVGLFLFTLRESPAPGSSQQLSQWRSPTDFLLRTPGDEVIRSAPTIGIHFSTAFTKENL